MNRSELITFLNTTEVPFCDLIIMRDHEVLFRYGRGYRDEELTRAVDGTELYNLYSASKVMAGAIGVKTIELGLIALDDPVCKYLPEYADMLYDTDKGPCRVGDDMRLFHLFTMGAGLDYALAEWEPLGDFLASTNGNATTRDFAALFAKKKLHFKPGEGFKYSLCLDVLGAVLEVASGMRLGELFRKYIWGPLGMSDTTFIPTAEQDARICAQYEYTDGGFSLTSKRGRIRLSNEFEGMGGGIISSVDDYSKFADALACTGVGANGVRILSPESLSILTEPRLFGKCREDFLAWSPKYAEYSYGLGVRVRTENQGHIPVGEFGWNSIAGHYALIDPANRLSVFYAQHVFGHSGRANTLIHPVIRDAAYCIAEIK